MPRRRGSWHSTVPWVGGGEEAARELWRVAVSVVSLRSGIFLHVYHLVLVL
jgi:hypothetical protein